MAATLPDGFTVDADQPPVVAAPPAGFSVDPDTGHAVTGPTGSLLSDAGHFLGTAALHLVNGLMTPVVGHGGVSIDPENPGIRGLRIDPPATPVQTDEARGKFNDALFNTTGIPEYQPTTEAGKIGLAATTGAMGAPFGGGLLSGAAGGAAGQALTDTGVNPLAAALIGGVAGSKGANVATRAAGSMMPGAIDSGTLNLARSAHDYDIQVPLGKISNSPFTRFMDSTVRKMPFSGYGAMDETNQGNFNKGVAGTFGEDATKITPEVLNNAYHRIGGVYDDVASRTSIPASPQFMTDLQGVVDNSRLNLSADSVVPVERQAMNILDTAANNGGIISGKQFKDLTAKGGPVDTLKGSSDSGLRQAGQQFDTILKNHLAANATPEDVVALKQADTQYKALKTIEPLTMRADTAGGPTPSTGDISPAALNARVGQNYDNAARAPLGQLPLKDLGQIGQRFLKEPPSSGTAERSGIQGMLDHGGALASGIGAAIMGHEAGFPLHQSVPALAAAMIGPRLIGSYLRSPGPVNNALYGQSLSPLAQALLTQERLNDPGQKPLPGATAVASGSNSAPR